MPIVPIIIPFYKEAEKLKKCREAIAAQTWLGCEVFVRDNTHDNILFTAAVNEGLARYCWRDDVRYAIVLNQDAYMHPDCVRRLIEFMDANPECAVACPLQYQDNGGSRVVSWGGSLNAFPFGVHRTDAFERYTEPFETYWANGACMMIRVAAIRECGLFDKNMRFICSDADFSFTVRARGWKVCVVPAALCEHELNASGSYGSLEMQLVKCRDAAYFADKWLTGGLFKSLSFEGPKLAAIEIRTEAARLKRQIRSLEHKLGIAPLPADRPTWVMKMNVRPPVRGAGRF